MTYHSEAGQDVWLEENVFRGRRNGVFFEAGALDGILHSNSLFFERERGWSGLLVEANPSLISHLCANRPNSGVFPGALWSEKGYSHFEQINGGLFGWSGLLVARDDATLKKVRTHIPVNARPIVGVPTYTLEYVLDYAGMKSIDYLSLDIEGAELEVLKDFPFPKYDIDVIGVEDNAGDNIALADLLRGNGFEHLVRIGNDEIWRMA